MTPGRYNLVLTLAGRPVLRGWWEEESIAREQFASLVGQYGQPGAHVTLLDEETGETLTEWPDPA